MNLLLFLLSWCARPHDQSEEGDTERVVVGSVDEGFLGADKCDPALRQLLLDLECFSRALAGEPGEHVDHEDIELTLSGVLQHPLKIRTVDVRVVTREADVFVVPCVRPLGLAVDEGDAGVLLHLGRCSAVTLALVALSAVRPGPDHVGAAAPRAISSMGRYATGSQNASKPNAEIHASYPALPAPAG